MACDLLFELGSNSDEFLWRKLIRTRRRPFHYRRHSTSVSEYCAVFLWRDFLRGKAHEMYDAPEAIISSSEMMPGRGRCHSRVDSAEQHLETCGNNIGKLIRHGSSRKLGQESSLI